MQKLKTHYLLILSRLIIAIFCFVNGMTQTVFADVGKGKILFVLSSHEEKGSTGEKTGYYLSEAAHPWDVLSAQGYTIDFVSPKGGNPPVDGFDLNDPVNKRFWEDEGVQKKLKNTFKPKEINPHDYRAIYYVGGHGTMWDFPDNKTLANIATSIYENKGIISAVCHGPAALINIKISDGRYLVDGKNIAAFTNSEEEQVGLTDVVPFLLESKLKSRGANVITAVNWQSNVQVSQRLITGQNPNSAKGVAEAMLKLLEK